MVNPVLALVGGQLIDFFAEKAVEAVRSATREPSKEDFTQQLQQVPALDRDERRELEGKLEEAFDEASARKEVAAVAVPSPRIGSKPSVRLVSVGGRPPSTDVKATKLATGARSFGIGKFESGQFPVSSANLARDFELRAGALAAAGNSEVRALTNTRKDERDMSLLGDILTTVATGAATGLKLGLAQRVGGISANKSGFVPLPAIGRALAPVVAGGIAGGLGADVVGDIFTQPVKRRRRARHRLTSREIEELMILKSIFGSRSPIITIAGIRMLGRG